MNNIHLVSILRIFRTLRKRDKCQNTLKILLHFFSVSNRKQHRTENEQTKKNESINIYTNRKIEEKNHKMVRARAPAKERKSKEK